LATVGDRRFNPFFFGGGNIEKRITSAEEQFKLVLETHGLG
jgi:hypothetical protein